jgi:hypothetical protein
VDNTSNAASPIADDFAISGLSQIYDDDPKPVIITPLPGKSGGVITIHYEGTDDTPYTKSPSAPSAIGSYALTFDVAEDAGWNAATGLSAGTLAISEQTANPLDPLIADFDINGLSQAYDGKAKPVSVTPKLGKSGGAIRVYYAGTGGTTYPQSIAAPSAVGTYAVSFDITESLGWNAAGGLNAGTLTISDIVTNSIAELQTWLSAQPTNPPPAAPYYIVLNVSDLGGNFITAGSLGRALYTNDTKYVSLDLSGSTITSIGDSAFYGCTSLTSITIPSNVTSIEMYAFSHCTSLARVTIPSSVTRIWEQAFSDCTGLTSVTFESTIPSSDFGINVFYGDLPAKFYATDPNNGTPGTYTTTAPVDWNSVWTLEKK